MFRNSRDRFMAFSDGVFAVILTVLVLEIRLPTGSQLLSSSWLHFAYAILIYVAGFSLISTYWYFHQKLFSQVHRLTGKLIVLNFYCLFFISLMPILTQVIAMDPLSKSRSFIYGLVYLIFNIYLWWLFRVVEQLLRHLKPWTPVERARANHQIAIVRNTAIVGLIACLCAWIWAPLTPLILAFSPLVRDVTKIF
ncbi:TMEM175 family protein [Lactiplantibacillus daowaiensis]|uniref:TMEM175 family protein n=1 Tax=Lactiplantibacillus daowaiensis TaxID=2559918 RepID=A0ABW1S328_9LACO